MRCRDVTRSLSAPTGTAGAEIADHLAACPRCASWAEQAARLDRAWAATRPAEPAASDFDAAWTAARRVVDEPRPIAIPIRTRRVILIGLAGLAQAAALVVAVWIPWRDRGPEAVNPPDPIASIAPPDPAPVQAEMSRVDLAEGQISIIHLNGRAEPSLELATYEVTGGVTVALDLECFNTFEAMATP